MFQKITEETLKVRPLYIKKKSHQLNPEVRYQAIAMAGDGDGFYGYAEAYRKQDRAAERAAKSRASLNWRQIELGYPPLNNPSTIPREARGQKGSLKFVIRPATAGVGINGPPMVRLMLRTIGVKDSLVRVQGDPRLGVN